MCFSVAYIVQGSEFNHLYYAVLLNIDLIKIWHTDVSLIFFYDQNETQSEHNHSPCLCLSSVPRSGSMLLESRPRFLDTQLVNFTLAPVLAAPYPFLQAQTPWGIQQNGGYSSPPTSPPQKHILL